MHNDSSQVVKDILVKVPHLKKAEHRLPADQRQPSSSRTFWSPAGRPSDQLPEAQPVGVQLRRGRTQTRLLHRWCHPPRSERNRDAHVRIVFFPRLNIWTALTSKAKTATRFLLSLVCAVSYTSQYGEKLYFRKFFKFQVRRARARVCMCVCRHYPALEKSHARSEEAWEMSHVCDNPSCGFPGSRTNRRL